jgi:hypothetical protein
MEETLQGVTELDEALEIARRDPSRSGFFYDAFLNGDLLMPVQLEGAEKGSWKQVGPKDRFKPLFLNYEQTKVVPVFDRLDRLQAWAGSRALDFVPLRGHIMLVLVSAEVGMVLNLATNWTYYFSPEILQRLRTVMKPVTPS